MLNDLKEADLSGLKWNLQSLLQVLIGKKSPVYRQNCPTRGFMQKWWCSFYIMSLNGVRNCWVSPICFLLSFNPFFGFVQACSPLLTLLLFPWIILFLSWFSELRTCFSLLASCRLPCWLILGNLSLKTLSFILCCVWAYWVGTSVCVYACENWKGQHPVLVLVMLHVLYFEIVSH